MRIKSLLINASVNGLHPPSKQTVLPTMEPSPLPNHFFQPPNVEPYPSMQRAGGSLFSTMLNSTCIYAIGKSSLE
jgi:hypothetical protein